MIPKFIQSGAQGGRVSIGSYHRLRMIGGYPQDIDGFPAF
jgi:hypothetical protein